MIEGWKDRKTKGQKDRETEKTKIKNRKIEREKTKNQGRETDRQTDKKLIDGKIDRQTNLQKCNNSILLFHSLIQGKYQDQNNLGIHRRGYRL